MPSGRNTSSCLPSHGRQSSSSSHTANAPPIRTSSWNNPYPKSFHPLHCLMALVTFSWNSSDFLAASGLGSPSLSLSGSRAEVSHLAASMILIGAGTTLSTIVAKKLVEKFLRHDSPAAAKSDCWKGCDPLYREIILALRALRSALAFSRAVTMDWA